MSDHCKNLNFCHHLLQFWGVSVSFSNDLLGTKSESISIDFYEIILRYFSGNYFNDIWNNPWQTPSSGQIVNSKAKIMNYDFYQGMRGILFWKGCLIRLLQSEEEITTLLNIHVQRQIWLLVISLPYFQSISSRTPYFIFLICILPYFPLMLRTHVRWAAHCSKSPFYGKKLPNNFRFFITLKILISDIFR